MSLVSKIRPRNFASLTTFIDVFFSQKNVRVWGKNVLLVKVDADCLGGGKLKAVLQSCKEVKYGKE